MEVIQADLTWTGQTFEEGIEVVISDDGRIAEVRPRGRGTDPAVSLTGLALIPGMVNAHSHAFQRGLRGRGERFEAGKGSFWSWRERMYELVESVDEKSLYQLSRRAFQEMLAGGITTVGEFHYLHHSGSGDYALDSAVMEAARDSGIRLALLNSYYRTGGIGQPLAGAQKRFLTSNLSDYWKQMDSLAASAGDSMTSLGVVAHSIRAADIGEIAELYQEAVQRGMVFHMHLEEQPLEIEQCLEQHGARPMQLITDRLAPGPDFTAVHCTHSQARDLDRFQSQGAGVCICPLTEANLGDGIANLSLMMRNSSHIALGTDSNSRICFWEELRWLEYVQRLKTRKRGICRDDKGAVAPRLFQMATGEGARALGLQTGKIAQGLYADLACIDLSHPSLEGYQRDTLIDSLVFGVGASVVCKVCVGGRWREVGSGLGD